MEKTRYTTRVLYMRGNSCGSQYAPTNCEPYGTKWRVRLVVDDIGVRQSLPVLLDANWQIDEKKIEKTIDLLNDMHTGFVCMRNRGKR